MPVGPPSPAPLAVGLCLAAGTLLLYTASLSISLSLSSPSLDDTFPLLFSKRVLILLFRTARDTDYLLITEDVQEYGCGCCSIGVGELV